jgi:hypothetical protein
MLQECRMKFHLPLAALGAIWLALLPAGAALAECLAPGKARELVTRGDAIPLVAAVRAAQATINGEMIGGRLCNDGAGYVYIVTFLAPDGRVSRVTIDGRSGAILSVR